MDFRNFTNADPGEWEDYQELRSVKMCKMKVPFFVSGPSGAEYGDKGDWLVETQYGDRFIVKNKVIQRGERFSKV